MLLIAFSSEGVVQLSFMTTSCSPPCTKRRERNGCFTFPWRHSDTLTASSKAPLGGRNVTWLKYCTRGYKFKISSLYNLLCPFLLKFTVHWFKFSISIIEPLLREGSTFSHPKTTSLRAEKRVCVWEIATAFSFSLSLSLFWTHIKCIKRAEMHFHLPLPPEENQGIQKSNPFAVLCCAGSTGQCKLQRERSATTMKSCPQGRLSLLPHPLPAADVDVFFCNAIKFTPHQPPLNTAIITDEHHEQLCCTGRHVSLEWRGGGWVEFRLIGDMCWINR